MKLNIKSFLLCCLVFVFTAGCTQVNSPKRAQEDTKQSQLYYERALKRYKDLIANSPSASMLYFELGKLYYDHGEFTEAAAVFKKAKNAGARKLAAITYYRMGNFTDALEIFNKIEPLDNESLYYYGLTSEKLNLFDQAQEAYKKIKEGAFKPKAITRINIIEKQVGLMRIVDVDKKTAQLLAGAPSQDNYPQAGALILSCDEKVEVNANNSQVSYLHYLVKILNDRGKEEFSEAHIEYDTTFEKVELEYARTISPDGTVVNVGSRHIRDVSKYLNFPLYSNAHIYIISFPEISDGSVIEYKIKIYNNQLINKKDFVLNYPLQSHDPIIAADFSVSVPKDKPLHIKIINEQYNDFGANLKAATEEKDGRVIYSWSFKNIPQIIPEANMPDDVKINPTLLVSTFNSWQDVYAWWWPLAKPKIEADSAIKSKVNELIKDKIQTEDKIRAIYNFCAQEIRYVAVEYGQAGYEPHKAADIFQNKYGDCKDKAILLVTMLKEAGVISWPLLISTKGGYNLNEDFPSVMFNHCIVALALNEKIIFLDPTAQTCSFADLPVDDQARKVLIFQDNAYKIENTPLYPAEHNLLKQSLKLKINQDESIMAEKSIFAFGIYDQAERYWLLYTQPQLIQEALKEKIQDISIGSILEKYNIDNLDDLNTPVILSYIFKGPEYFSMAGNLRIMPQLASLDASLVAKNKRKYDLEFPALDAKETISEIEIPRNFIIKYLPDNVTEDTPWLKFTVKYIRQAEKIVFSQRSEFKKNIIPAAEYADFKKFFEGTAKRIKQRIILEKRG